MGDEFSISERLVGLFPGVPYLAFGFALAWTSLLFSGKFWASDVTSAGFAIYSLFADMAVSGAITFLVVGGVSAVREWFRNAPVCTGAVVSFIGSAGVILAGPYFQEWLGMESEPIVALLFTSGALLMGVGSSLIMLLCGRLYGELSPQNALCYTALSYLLCVCVYFVGIAGPTAAPFAGGPTWYSMALLVALPFVACWFAGLARFAPKEQGFAESQSSALSAQAGLAHAGSQSHSALSASLVFKPLVVLVVVSAIVSYVHFQAISSRASSETVEANSFIMLIRIFVCVAILLLLLNGDNHRRNLGDIYTRGAVVLAVLMGLIPLVNGTGIAGDLLVGFLLTLYEVSVWCVLAFVAYQKRIDPLRVYGIGYGCFVAGEGVGCALVAFAAPAIHAAGVETVFFLALVGVELIAALVVFSGADFEKLTTGVVGDRLLMDAFAEESLSRSAMLREHSCTPGDAGDAYSACSTCIYSSDDQGGRRQASDGRRSFDTAIEQIAEEAALSAREKDVLALLAKGLSNDRAAEELFISRNTVRTHAQNVYSKLGVHSRQELMRYVNDRVQAMRQH